MTGRRDLIAGLFFTALGAAATVLALRYDAGTARQMGPGYMPARAGWILCAVGLSIAVRSRRRTGSGTDPRPAGVAAAARPLVVIGAVAVFALSIERAGLAIAAPALVVISTLADRDYTALEIALLAIALTAAAALVFVWALGLPVDLLAVG